jgi:short-subunit dehydrogenase
VVTMICPGFIRTSLTLSALTADGSALNRMDAAQYRGMPAEWCARKIVSAIGKDKEEVYIGGREVFAVYLKRFLPAIFSKVIRNVAVR